MRYALLVLLFLTTTPAQAPGGKQLQTAFCPKTAELETVPSGKYWFDGNLGQKHVRLFLERGGGGVVGVFYDTADWVPLIVGGRWSGADEGTIEVTARNQRDAVLAVLKGQIAAHGFTGTWNAESEGSGVPLQLKAVARPKCDGSESWKVFSDKRWPITFSYPGSWHVNVSGDSITLTCPDASLMAYDGYEIDIKQGPDANTVTSDFVQCGDKWIYGHDDCKCGEEKGCKIAAAADHGGMTMLRGDEMEWRAYCRGGGYVGQDQGDRRVLTFDDNWIVMEGRGPVAELVERVVGTAKRRR